MKLLIVTQAVDTSDPVLGFFVRWIEEFAKRIERIEVICLREGSHDLPGNVRVHSLGKEKNPPRFLRRLAYAIRFKRLAWNLRRDYDAVFVHMNPEYVAIAGALWRLSGKRVVLWYTHRQTTLVLRIATLFTNAVATAAKESFRLSSRKTRVLGHGIDPAFFASVNRTARRDSVRLLSVARTTPIKRLEIILGAFARLYERGHRTTLTLVGAPSVPADYAYEEKMRVLAHELRIEPLVAWKGAVAPAQLSQIYAEHDFLLNAAPTGGIDKAVLEAMATGCVPVVANRAFADYFEPYGKLLIAEASADAFADTLERLLGRDLEDVRRALRESAERRASLPRIIAMLVALLHGTPS